MILIKKILNNDGSANKNTDNNRNFSLKMLPVQSQNLFQVELSEAFVFYDLIREPNDIANAYKGYGTHTSLDFWLGKKVSPRLELKAG